MSVSPHPDSLGATDEHGRRTLLRAAAWGAPAVLLAAASPAFATSPEAGISLRVIRNGDDDTGEVLVQNNGEEAREVRLEFIPAPDPATVGALVAYSGFEGFRQVSSDPFVLAGRIGPGEQSTAWTWWRDRADAGDPTASTTVRLHSGSQLLDEVTVSLGS